MAILFLTNNDISLSLYHWIKEKEENVILYDGKVTPSYIKQNNVSFIVSYNYRIIIKPDIVQLLPHKIVNLHTSFLPYNKGASPNIWGFIEGTPCGVTIHEIDIVVDTGDILVQEKIEFDHKTETLSSSYVKSNQKIQHLFKENWGKIKTNKIKPQKQMEKGTFHLSKELEPYKTILNYNDTIEEFLKKVYEIKCSKKNVT
ncbi:MAG: formyl transferase [Lachnospiraceae bacterium]|nr:formyl transferase [Lachnospiraceae bacterium]